MCSLLLPPISPGQVTQCRHTSYSVMHFWECVSALDTLRFIVGNWAMFSEEEPPYLEDFWEYEALRGSLRIGLHVCQGNHVTSGFLVIFEGHEVGWPCIMLRIVAGFKCLCERLWSSCGFLHHGRTRLTEEHFLMECFTRWNAWVCRE